MDNDCILGEWGDWLAATNHSERTAELYVGAAHRFLSRRYVRGRSLLTLSSSEILAHLAEIGKHGPARRQSRVALRSLFLFMFKRGYRSDDPTAILDGAREPKHKTKPSPFTVDELTRLVIAAAGRDPRRGWAILACHALGARRTEFVMLRPEDIHWDTHRVHFAITKGDKPRDVDMGPLAETALRKLLALGPSPKGETTGTILGVHPQTFGGWVNQAGRDCGFPWGRKRRAHTLRSTFATRLGQAGVPVAVIRDLMGHESIQTTDVYLGVYEGECAAAVQLL